jgi:hypothetical protein
MNRTFFGALVRRNRLAISLGGIAAACAVILPACGGGGDTGLPVATSMTISVTSTPATGSVLVGLTRQFAFEVLDQDGIAIPDASANWSIVGGAGVATITTNGLATCVTAGSVTVHAVGPQGSAGVELTADALLQCAARAATTMTILVTSTPATGSIPVGATRQYTIEVRDQANAVMSSLTNAVWSIVGTAGIATISTGALATCVSAGTVTAHALGPASGSGVNLTADATLLCAAAAVPATMAILVTSSPATGSVLVGAGRQYAIEVRDQSNAVLSAFTTATWSISGTVASVTQQGLATCNTVGTANVHAVGPVNGSGTNLTADASLVCAVAPPAVTTVVVSPPSAYCLVGATMQFTAKAFDGTGAEVVGGVTRWLLDNSNVGTVSGTGLVNCTTAGTSKVRAFAGSGASAPGGSADLTVVASTTIVSVHVSVFHTFLSVAFPTIQLSATAFNAAGVQVTGVTFVWGGSNSAASVNASGLVTGAPGAAGLVNGGALITATTAGVTGTAAISVGNTGAIFAPLVNANGAPAEGAILTAYQGTTVVGTGITSYSGRGYIPGLNAGTYTVTVSLAGYVTQTFTGIAVTVLNATSLVNPITMSQ